METVLIKDSNVSRFINTFRNVNGVHFIVESIFSNSALVFVFKCKAEEFQFTIFNYKENQIISRHLNTYKRQITVQPENSCNLDSIGLHKMYRAICEDFGIKVKLSNDIRCEILLPRPLKTETLVSYEETWKQPKHRKIKPYYSEFNHENFKNMKSRKKRNDSKSLIDTYCTEVYSSEGNYVGYKFLYNFQNSQRERVVLFENIAYNPSLKKGFVGDLLSALYDGKIVKPNKPRPSKPEQTTEEWLAEIIGKKPKKKFSNPRIINKTNLRKHVEEFHNSRDFYELIKTL